MVAQVGSQPVDGHAHALEDLDGRSLSQLDEPHQQVLGTYERHAHVHGLVVGQNDGSPRAAREAFPSLHPTYPS